VTARSSRRRGRDDVTLIRPLRDFLHTEAAGGALLAVAAAAALIWANTAPHSYDRVWNLVLSIQLGTREFSWDLRHWVNDGLMTLFFFMVGLEIKRELTSGHLADRRSAALPALAAVGGMAVPALLYLAIAGGVEPDGWGIPVATDIALAIGVAATLGRRVPAGMRTFLLALAIVDDIGAITIIAVFYSEGVEVGWLLVSVGCVAAVVAIKRIGVTWHIVYVLIGMVGWYGLTKAGVHPTLMGVSMGLLAPSIPLVRPELADAEELADVSTVEAARTTARIARQSISVVEWLEHELHPWVSYAIVPMFALANAGVPVGWEPLSDAVTSRFGAGIIVGLVVGKLVGVVGTSWLAIRLGVGKLPESTPPRVLVGTGALAGIGFTVALFVSELAVEGERLATAKLAVLVASALAATLGAAILWRSPKPVRSDPPPQLEGRSVSPP
jgi:NhaA family Na+:H+ antiporter